MKMGEGVWKSQGSTGESRSPLGLRVHLRWAVISTGHEQMGTDSLRCPGRRASQRTSGFHRDEHAVSAMWRFQTTQWKTVTGFNRIIGRVMHDVA